MPHAAEAGQFQQAGHSAAICAPGAIGQAHRADEHVLLDQLAAAEIPVGRLIARLTGRAAIPAP